jgi:putative zinc ribbon protein
MSASKNCQSCGMPMSRDAKGGGTNADGSKSPMYCSHCFAGGKFTLPDLTVDQMQERVRDKMKEMGFPRMLSWVFTRKIPRLQRWSAPGPGRQA